MRPKDLRFRGNDFRVQPGSRAMSVEKGWRATEADPLFILGFIRAVGCSSGSGVVPRWRGMSGDMMEGIMKERGILFNGEMIRAEQAGRKTQTRRVVKPRYIDDYESDGEPGDICLYMGEFAKLRDRGNALGEMSAIPYTPPYGQVGDRLWVREAFRPKGMWSGSTSGTEIEYRAGGDTKIIDGEILYSVEEVSSRRWTPSIHMPRWASRTILELTAVRVERLQDITAEDCVAEGIPPPVVPDGMFPEDLDYWTAEKRDRWFQDQARADYIAACGRSEDLIEAFAALWSSINAKRGYSWESNPYVWVYVFKRI